MKLKSQKPHIGIFGRRNYGKSSLINSLANQDIAIVADLPGTTTDPVRKSMEITGMGPVIISDTAGIDDSGEVGQKRVDATLKEIPRVDLAIIVINNNLFEKIEEEIIEQLNRYKTPFFILHNKSDLEKLKDEKQAELESAWKVPVIEFSTKSPDNRELIINTIKKEMPPSIFSKPTIIGDLVHYGSSVLLITPIDIEAPAGRLILPQIQMIRDALDNDCITTIIKEREIEAWRNSGYPEPDLVITDSQTFLKADSSIPSHIPLTSFSIALAHQQGPFEHYLEGTPKISQLEEGDRILIMESCTHHVSCDDIGRVKIPRWISNFTGKKLHFETTAGLDTPPRPLEEYSLVVQCGGCMVTKKQLRNRLLPAIEKNIAITNYGMAISWCLGIYNRAVKPFTSGVEDSSSYL